MSVVEPDELLSLYGLLNPSNCPYVPQSRTFEHGEIFETSTVCDLRSARVLLHARVRRVEKAIVAEMHLVVVVM